MVFELSELICRAVERSLEDRVAVSFSGGLDSAVIATIAKKHAQVELISCGCGESPDIESAIKASAELGLPLSKILVDEKLALETYGKCHSILPIDFLKLEILVPVHCVAEAAVKSGHNVLLFGAGAEELFVGYERYYQYREEGKDLDRILRDEFNTLPQRDIGRIRKICKKCGIEARFPFYDKEIAKAVFSIPLDERMEDRELKKGLLREAAKLFGTPESALRRRKKAMQYGSGIHKMLLKHADEINRSFPASL